MRRESNTPTAPDVADATNDDDLVVAPTTVKPIDRDNITLDDLRRLKQVFDDSAEDGQLNEDGFLAAFGPILGQSMADDELRMWFMRIDASANDSIDWDEFSTFLLYSAGGGSGGGPAATKATAGSTPGASSLKRAAAGGANNPNPSANGDVLFVKDSRQVSVAPTEGSGTRISGYNHADAVSRILCHSHVPRYYTASADGTVRVWDANSLELECLLHHSKAWVTDMLLAKAESKLLLTSVDRVVAIYDTHSHRLARAFVGNTTTTEKIRMSFERPCTRLDIDLRGVSLSRTANSDGDSLEAYRQRQERLRVSQSTLPTVDLHVLTKMDFPAMSVALASATEAQSLVGNAGFLGGVHDPAGDQRAFFGLSNGSIQSYDVFKPTLPDALDCDFHLDAHRGFVTCLKWSPAAGGLFSSGSDGVLGMVHLEKNVLVSYTGQHSTHPIHSFDWLETNRVFVTCGTERTINLWAANVASREGPPMVLAGHLSSVTHVVCPKGETFIVSMDADKCVKVWDTRTLRCIQSSFDYDVYRPMNRLTAISYDDKRRCLVTAAVAPTVWPMSRLLVPYPDLRYNGHQKAVVAMFHNRDFGQIVTLDSESAMLWSLETGTLFLTMTVDTLRNTAVRSAATNEAYGAFIGASLDFSGRRLILGLTSATAMVANFANGQLLREMVPMLERATRRDFNAAEATSMAYVTAGAKHYVVCLRGLDLLIWEDTAEGALEKRLDRIVRFDIPHSLFCFLSPLPAAAVSAVCPPVQLWRSPMPLCMTGLPPQHLAIGTDANVVVVFSSISFEPIVVFGEHDSSVNVNSVFYAPHLECLLSARSDGRVMVNCMGLKDYHYTIDLRDKIHRRTPNLTAICVHVDRTMLPGFARRRPSAMLTATLLTGKEWPDDAAAAVDGDGSDVPSAAASGAMVLLAVTDDEGYFYVVDMSTFAFTEHATTSHAVVTVPAQTSAASPAAAAAPHPSKDGGQRLLAPRDGADTAASPGGASPHVAAANAVVVSTLSWPAHTSTYDPAREAYVVGGRRAHAEDCSRVVIFAPSADPPAENGATRPPQRFEPLVMTASGDCQVRFFRATTGACVAYIGQEAPLMLNVTADDSVAAAAVEINLRTVPYAPVSASLAPIDYYAICRQNVASKCRASFDEHLMAPSGSRRPPSTADMLAMKQTPTGGGAASAGAGQQTGTLGLADTPPSLSDLLPGAHSQAPPPLRLGASGASPMAPPAPATTTPGAQGSRGSTIHGLPSSLSQRSSRAGDASRAIALIDVQHQGAATSPRESSSLAAEGGDKRSSRGAGAPTSSRLELHVQPPEMPRRFTPRSISRMIISQSSLLPSMRAVEQCALPLQSHSGHFATHVSQPPSQPPHGGGGGSSSVLIARESLPGPATTGGHLNSTALQSMFRHCPPGPISAALDHGSLPKPLDGATLSVLVSKAPRVCLDRRRRSNPSSTGVAPPEPGSRAAAGDQGGAWGQKVTASKVHRPQAAVVTLPSAAAGHAMVPGAYEAAAPLSSLPKLQAPPPIVKANSNRTLFSGPVPPIVKDQHQRSPLLVPRLHLESLPVKDSPAGPLTELHRRVQARRRRGSSRSTDSGLINAVPTENTSSLPGGEEHFLQRGDDSTVADSAGESDDDDDNADESRPTGEKDGCKPLSARLDDWRSAKAKAVVAQSASGFWTARPHAQLRLPQLDRQFNTDVSSGRKMHRHFVLGSGAPPNATVSLLPQIHRNGAR